MTLAARILVARAQATSRKAARKRRAELERRGIGLVAEAAGPEIRHAGAGYLAAGSGCFAL